MKKIFIDKPFTSIVIFVVVQSITVFFTYGTVMEVLLPIKFNIDELELMTQICGVLLVTSVIYFIIDKICLKYKNKFTFFYLSAANVLILYAIVLWNFRNLFFMFKK